MRPKTDKEKEFNEVVVSHGIKAFTAQQFDENTELQKAFDSFVEYTDFDALTDPIREGEKLVMHYMDFLASYDNIRYKCDHHTRNKYDNSNAELCISSLFELHSPVKEITCWEYFDAFLLDHNMLPAHENTSEVIAMNIKIKTWHKTRREIDKIKPFVEARFPRWSKASKEENKSYIESIKKEIFDLEILGVDTVKLKRVLHFLKNYTGLNKLNKYKVDFLLDLKLPLIDSQAIAKKIIDNSEL